MQDLYKSAAEHNAGKGHASMIMLIISCSGRATAFVRGSNSQNEEKSLRVSYARSID